MKVTMPYDVQVSVPGTDRQVIVSAGTPFEYPDEQAVARVDNPDDHMEAHDPEQLAEVRVALDIPDPATLDAAVESPAPDPTLPTVQPVDGSGATAQLAGSEVVTADASQTATTAAPVAVKGKGAALASDAAAATVAPSADASAASTPASGG